MSRIPLRFQKVSVLGSILYTGILVCGSLSSQTAPWIDHIVSSDFDSPYTVQAVDIDGDGDLDLVSASRDDDEVSWWENVAGDGSTWTETLIDTAFAFPFSVDAADFDGDGDMDVIAASWDDDLVSWYTNLNGDGSNWSEIVISSTLSQPDAVEAADMDGDGDADAVTAARLDGTVVYHENVLGDGSLWKERVVSSVLQLPGSVHATDLDGDGDLDVLSASNGDDQIYWHENLSGDGTVWLDHSITTTAFGVYNVFAGDLDGDGDMDVLSAASDIVWYENLLGDGTTWVEQIISGPTSSAASLAVGDIDQDGDMDVFAGLFSGSIIYYANLDGQGITWAKIVITDSLDSVTFVVAADIDGDGDLDAASSTNTSNRITFHENRLGQGPFWVRREVGTSVFKAEAFGTADLDADGDLDLIGGLTRGSSGTDGVFWFSNDGKASSWIQNTVSTSVGSPQAVAPADIDGDGDTDIVVGSSNLVELGWFENQPGTSGDWVEHGIVNTNTLVFDIVPADMDGDGDLDVVSSTDSGLLDWHENLDRIGQLWTARPVTSEFGKIRGIDVVDLDNDGDLDVVATAVDEDILLWFRNVKGDALAWFPVQISGTVDGPNDVASGDLDGDGSQDLALTSKCDDSVRVFLNQLMHALHWTEILLTATALEANSITIADLDEDGALDVVRTSEEDSALVWHRNVNGDATVWEDLVITSDGREPHLPLVADFDGDRDLDVAMASRDTGELYVFLQPQQLFAIDPLLHPGPPPAFPTVSGSPRPGVELVLEFPANSLRIPDDALFYLALSRASAPGLGAPFSNNPRELLGGNLLDVVPVSLGKTSSGPLIVRIPIPNDPTLGGEWLAVQGLKLAQWSPGSPPLTVTTAFVLQLGH